MRQLPQVPGLARLRLQVTRGGMRPGRVVIDQEVRQPQVHRQRNELLLGAVVDLAAMQHGNGPVRAGDQRQIPARQDRQGRSSQRLPRPGGRAVQLGAERQPYLRRRRGTPAVDDAVREVLDPLAERLEGHRDHGRRDGGEGQAGAPAGQRPGTGHGRCVNRGDEYCQRPEHDRLADDQVQVIQAVLQDSHRDGDGDQREQGK